MSKRFYPSKTGKYDENGYDDLYSLFGFHQPRLVIIDDIEEMMAEVCGENERYKWWWILKLRNGKYCLLSAWCDYTGWDCQSGIDSEELFDTAEEAALASPTSEEYTQRNIQRNLLRQINNEQAFGIYE